MGARAKRPSETGDTAVLGLCCQRAPLLAARPRYALGTGPSAKGFKNTYFAKARSSAAIAAAVYSPPERFDRKDTQARDIPETDSADLRAASIVARLTEQAAAIISRAFEPSTAASVSAPFEQNAR